jgi:hypothetical protein
MTVEPHELVALVEDVAARPELWAHHADPAAHGADLRRAAPRRGRRPLGDFFWLPENDTGWHDHDTSSGAVHVVAGALEEHALLLGAPERRRLHRAGSTFSFDPSHIHRLTCAGARAVSIHAYSPPLWRLGQYSVDAERVLHRLSVSYADELRPLTL